MKNTLTSSPMRMSPCSSSPYWVRYPALVGRKRIGGRIGEHGRLEVLVLGAEDRAERLATVEAHEGTSFQRSHDLRRCEEKKVGELVSSAMTSDGGHAHSSARY